MYGLGFRARAQGAVWSLVVGFEVVLLRFGL